MTEFVSTFWTEIESARGADAAALENLVNKYRHAVVAFARAQGIEENAAEDVAQDVFLALVNEGVLAKVDRAHGRFRNLMMKLTRHIILRHRRHATVQKRGGGRLPLSLDAESGEGGVVLAGVVAAEENDPDFDRAWTANLVEIAMTRLRDDCARRGTSYHGLLVDFARDGRSYRELADRTGKTENDIKNILHIARRKLTRFLQSEIHSTCSGDEDAREETEYLSRFLTRA